MDSMFKITGFLNIIDATTKEILFDGSNGVNYENLSLAICNSLCAGTLNVASATGFFYSLAFGNGGTSVSPTGVITYNPPNIIGTNASLYNQTYSKVINNNFSADIDTVNNYLTVSHTVGNLYTDILLTCRLDYAEPAGQAAFDNTTDFNGTYVFDELGILSSSGQLLTHVVFNPVQKSLNRLIEINYTVRIQTASSLIS